MIHLRGIWYAKRERRPRCDTAALAMNRDHVRRQLQDDKAEKIFDAHLPRHFHEREARRRGDCT